MWFTSILLGGRRSITSIQLSSLGSLSGNSSAVTFIGASGASEVKKQKKDQGMVSTSTAQKYYVSTIHTDLEALQL